MISTITCEALKVTGTRLSDLLLMAIQVDTLFRCDPDGRLRHVNEPDTPLAPRFFMGRTPAGLIWRTRFDLPADSVEQLDDLCRSELPTADLRSPPRNYAAIKAVLHEHAPIANEYRGPAYSIPDSIKKPEDVVEIAEANAYLLQEEFSWLLPLPRDFETGPIVAAVVAGRAVSVCFCSRLAGQAAEAGVETVKAFRGMGYASAVVAGWAAAVRRMGRMPLYSTSWDNLASQGVARKLGMLCYGEDWSLG
jgi:hypothetical protein